MRILDIHSHILPAVDDGAKSIEESLQLLEMMHSQGITDVIATPHFDASTESLESFTETVTAALALLKSSAGPELPNIYLGSEVFYFGGIGRSNGIKALTLGGSDHILLELPFGGIDKNVLKDVTMLSDNLGLSPILAHVERYSTEHGFKEVLGLIESGYAEAQVNALSLIQPPYKRITHKLIKKGLIRYIATDTHSTDRRPPFMDKALEEVESSFGKHQRDAFVRHSDSLCAELAAASAGV